MNAAIGSNTAFLAPLVLATWCAGFASASPVTFAVSAVDKAGKPLAAVAAVEVLHAAGGDVFEAAPDLKDQFWLSPGLTSPNAHPVVAAAHLAFAQHRPLALSPDIIWLLINQMAAREVVAAPEQYRAIFAAHQEGQRTLSVRRDQFVPGSADNDWPGVFAEFEAQITAQAPDPLAATFSHPFESSQPWEIAARRVTLLKTVSPFFKFEVGTMCGIPEIQLHGSAADWAWIRAHAEGFRKLGMSRRIDALLPVLDQFSEAAAGKADAAFWRSFYKFASQSGCSFVSGWINLFFIGETDPLLEQVLEKDFNWRTAPLRKTSLGAMNLPLPQSPREYPTGIVEQEFVWKLLGESRPMLLRAGFFGISQDPISLTLQPQLAWQVRQAKESSDRRALRREMQGERELWVGRPISQINKRWVYDEKLKQCRKQDPNAPASGDSDIRVWREIIPLMTNLEEIDLGVLLPFDRSGDPSAADAEICRLLLALPRIKTITLPSHLAPACRRILEDRKDWTLKSER